jgi:hypothetical protein
MGFWTAMKTTTIERMSLPNRNFPPVTARLCQHDWFLTCWLLKKKTRQLNKTRFGQMEEQIWLMEQTEHLRALKANNLPFILGQMLNP